VKDVGRPRPVEGGDGLDNVSGLRVVAVAGIARPDRFFKDVEAAGCILARSFRFPDHHPFTHQDVDRLSQAFRESRADLVLTTEKDMVRLLPLRPLGVPVAWLPIAYTVTPPDEFRAWLTARIAGARDQKSQVLLFTGLVRCGSGINRRHIVRSRPETGGTACPVG
jgi:tetraacyldisaccharide-1-P 4'-kinase